MLTPRLWVGHLALALALAAVWWLSGWQLDTWRAERTAAERDVGSIRPVVLDELLGPDDVFGSAALGRQAVVKGTWLPQVFFVMRDQGFWVVSPVRVDSSGSAILVVRGGAERPVAAPMSGPAALTGWLQAGEGSRASDSDPADEIFPELRIPSFVERIDQDLYGGYVVANPPTDGLSAVTQHDVPPVSQTTGLRNLLYGIQWWIFGGFAVFIWWRWCRDQLAAARPQPVAE